LAVNLLAAAPGCLERTLPVTVKDKKGGRFRKQPVEVLSVEWDVGPRRIVLVLDHSGSMRTAMPVARGVAARMIQHAPSDVSLALQVFAKEVAAELDFSESPAALLDGVASLSDEAYDRTALFGSLRAAAVMLRPRQGGDVVYAITDGVDSWSGGEWDEAEALLASKGVRLFVLRLISHRVRWSSDARSVARLTRLVESTGGSMMSYAPPAGSIIRRSSNVYKLEPEQETVLAAMLGLLYQEIDRFYRVRVRLPRAVDKSRKWKLEVVDQGAKKRKDLIVIYPQRLFPCEQESGTRTTP
jgi:hypothetical protein